MITLFLSSLVSAEAITFGSCIINWSKLRELLVERSFQTPGILYWGNSKLRSIQLGKHMPVSVCLKVPNF